MKTMYHVFTNNNDDWTDDYGKAVNMFSEFKNGYGCARLYEEKWKNPDIDDEPIEENCIKSFGEWPL